ncbi:hypothetical protein ASPZODRAFT_2109441 [Penicilliopsis zonata CBS 506.65]|uniref:Major facilitator superfamily (MFS) profile domain-containing protein n=1 Tax=Penicilliopsis zonata CBS 506.65 TaxID=1073090 RepID=A0A1L9SDI3_9EURO|nr:hypothetical protein ASPZODRAFT_2109441 [Penicilliopsis zonata CBS 506.65]OJJ45198.1 hypothetical protein ASPZODRAFT_2109441 [Penicilliopsis zonata CBS 506.65]
MAAMASMEHGYRLNLPGVQNFIAGLVLFGTVGIYVAISALGAGGGKSTSVEMNNIVSSVNYGVFTVTGFFGGSIINRFGPRWSILLGAFGYPFYVAGLFYYDRVGNLAFPVVGGAVIGATASQLWTGVNYIAFAYADENNKGRFYGTQAAMKAAGNVVASALTLGLTANNRSSSGVPTAVYVAFICIMLAAMALAVLVVKPEKVRRRDGTAIAIFHHDSFKQEFQAVARLVFDHKAMLLVPCLIVADFQLILQPQISAKFFNTRTRSLLTFVAAIVEVIATLGFGLLLDHPAWPRRVRAKVGILLMSLLIFGIYSGEAGWLFRVISAAELASEPAYDWTDPSFAGFFVIFVVFNTLGSVAPVYIAWLLASLTNDPKKSAAYAGLLRSAMAAGVAIGFGIASAGVTIRTQFVIQIVTQFLAIGPQIWVAFRYVRDTNYGLEDDVIIPEEVLEGIEKVTMSAVPEKGLS